MQGVTSISRITEGVSRKAKSESLLVMRAKPASRDLWSLVTREAGETTPSVMRE